jgi:hypothetical protein
MKKSKSNAIKGFNAVDFVRKTRRQINKDTQNMNFEEIKKYFEQRKLQQRKQLKIKN